MAWILVFLGGGLGSALRYALHVLFASQTFYQALLPNLIGCFCIGLCSSLIVSGDTKIFLILGVLGGFTTFSSYVAFIGQSGCLTPTVMAYFFCNNALGLLLYFLGAKLAVQVV